MKRALLWSCIASFAFSACTNGGESGIYGGAADETGIDHQLGLLPDSEKADFAASGPPVSIDPSLEVWQARNRWSDRTTPDAKRAGLAWAENSGLSWEEKYGKWLESLEQDGQTFKITLPYGGKSITTPRLECAEVAMFLRIMFSSWYHLPFYMTGYDNGRVIYAGNFGFVTSDGSRYANFPSFKSQYRDYEGSWQPGQAWPTDDSLRAYHLGSDDSNEFLGEGAGAGAYFDEVYLNKRVGYFTRLLLLYFGSINLADPANLFQLMPRAIRAGDVQLERWAKEGIGHTVPILRVESPEPGTFAVTVATGYMPRRQPYWEDASRTREYFTESVFGGPGHGAFGGGLHRWRTPVLRGDRWSNEVPQEDASYYIDAADIAQIEARTTEFADILATFSPEQMRDAALAKVESARQHLRMYPASCGGREERETAFRKLYDVMSDVDGSSPEEVDAQYRTLEDYVFAPLEYMQSKTCCWNSSTSDMANIVLEYAQREQQQATSQGMCINPTVFRARSNGYDTWKNFAAETGRANVWLDWKEDEPCPWRGVAEDTEKAVDYADWCSIQNN